MKDFKFSFVPDPGHSRAAWAAWASEAAADRIIEGILQVLEAAQ